MNSILDEHASLKRINKYKLKFKSNLWISPAIQKSIIIKNNVLKRFINAKIRKQKKLFTGNIRITETCHRHFSKKQNKLLQLIFQSKYEHHIEYYDGK